eukprot:1158641-Pelagomonas_calceolata.AAC.8
MQTCCIARAQHVNPKHYQSLTCASARVLKWRRKRLVTKVLPPPGGPMAMMVCTSVIARKALSRPASDHGGRIIA